MIEIYMMMYVFVIFFVGLALGSSFGYALGKDKMERHIRNLMKDDEDREK